MTNWTTERPKKPGDYWLSLHPSKRMGLHSALPVVLECNQTTSLHVRAVGDDGGWLGLSYGGWLDGALWAPRKTPADPFGVTDSHKDRL